MSRKICHVGHAQCTCGDTTEPQYLYRDLKGVSTFTGFTVQEGVGYVWIGKDQKQNRLIKDEDDMHFFMSEMRQYD